MRTSTTPHWSNCGFGGAVGVGVGQDDLTAAAQTVVDYFQSNPCTQALIPVVQTFQLTYNASGMPGQLTVDGQYGGNTERAVQNSLNTAPAAGGGGPVQNAPQNCFGMAVPDIPGVDPPVSGSAATTTTTKTTPAASGGASSGAIAFAVAAVVGGVGYAVYRARKRAH